MPNIIIVFHVWQIFPNPLLNLEVPITDDCFNIEPRALNVVAGSYKPFLLHCIAIGNFIALSYRIIIILSLKFNANN